MASRLSAAPLGLPTCRHHNHCHCQDMNRGSASDRCSNCCQATADASNSSSLQSRTENRPPSKLYAPFPESRFPGSCECAVEHSSAAVGIVGPLATHGSGSHI